MNRHRDSDASLLAARNRLGCTCGTNIDTEGVEFTNQRPNLMYTDKVFSFNQNTASPILFNLNTGGANTGNFTVELTLDSCSLFPCVLTSNAVFEIDNTFVAVEYFNTRPPGNITAPQVTLDGFPVDSVTYSNGQYTAVTTNVLPRVQKERCLNRNLPTKAFFLINNAGPWDIRAIYVLEGTVNTNGRTCRFRAEISNAPEGPNTPLPGGSLSNFAVPHLSVPCTINGVAPTILFQFNAKANLVNPRLVVTCTPGTVTPNCTVALVSTVAVEPVVHVETIRRTLFCINSCEGIQPCQGNLVAAELEDIAQECVLGGVDRPDCRCGRRGEVAGTGTCRRVEAESTGGCRRNEVLGTSIGCGTQTIPVGVAGEATVGTGTCEDCVFGATRMHDCRRPRVSGEEVMGESEEQGRCRHRRNQNDVLGASDRDCRRRMLEEIRDELLAAEDECDMEDDDVLGVMEEDTRRNRSRTAFMHNGTNGCSW